MPTPAIIRVITPPPAQRRIIRVREELLDGPRIIRVRERGPAGPAGPDNFPYVGALADDGSALDFWDSATGAYVGSTQLFDRGLSPITPP